MNCACLACYSGPTQLRDVRTPTFAAALPALSLLITTAAAFLAVPRAEKFFDEIDVPVPGLTVWCLSLFQFLRWTWPLWISLAVWVGGRIAQRRLGAKWGYLSGAAILIFWATTVFALFLPLLSIPLSIGGR